MIQTFLKRLSNPKKLFSLLLTSFLSSSSEDWSDPVKEEEDELSEALSMFWSSEVGGSIEGLKSISNFVASIS